MGTVILRREDLPELSHRHRRTRSPRRRKRRNHGTVTTLNRNPIIETYTNSKADILVFARVIQMIVVETMGIIATEIIIDLLRVTSPFV